MLVVTRRHGEAVIIKAPGLGPIRIVYQHDDTRLRRCRLSFDAPREVVITREELLAHESRMTGNGLPTSAVCPRS